MSLIFIDLAAQIFTMHDMKKYFLVPLSIMAFYGCGASKALPTADKTVILTQIDLVNVVDDKVMVSIDPGAFPSDNVAFYIPKTVPGTYKADNYGKYIEDFRALDYSGKELSFTKSDDNTWNISNGKALDKVTYWVNDTYDSEDAVEEPVFSPSGTNILAGENFVLNLHGFVGYFKGYGEVPYQLDIRKPAELFSTTSLVEKPKTKPDPTKESFLAKRYFEVIDNPILYAKPNKVTFKINDITVTLSVYAPEGTWAAADLKERMEKMMLAQKTFLGDINSTKVYNILLYVATTQGDAKGFGALEHHTSTVVVLPEWLPMEEMQQAMVDVVSHEFFHIVTPLNVHSKEIQFFDFNDPKMSRHLWMYEGTTEYFANLFQIQQGLIDDAEFYKRIADKMYNAKSYDDRMSFTEMSRNILKDPYKPNYANVYEKGTLINMCLDILLREWSHGEKGVLWLMKELSKKYGDNTPFEDDRLFEEIVGMTYPGLRAFFDDHVIGTVSIDYASYLSKVGLTTVAEEEESGYFLKGEIPYIDVDPAKGDSIFVRKGIRLNKFFERLGAEGGDVIKSINGIPIDLEAMRFVIGESFGWSPETEITMKVQRGETELILKGVVGSPMQSVDKIVPVDHASDAQLALRKAWMKG
jgi:predicted metalloprotease with PDZ domain